MRVAGRRATSLFDGLGINYVLFCQGCKHNCLGCQNPETWAMDGGVEMTVEEIESDIEKYMPLLTLPTPKGGGFLRSLIHGLTPNNISRRS